LFSTKNVLPWLDQIQRMKKLLLLAFSLILTEQVNAQCPVTVQGNPFFPVCAGTCVTFTASGAQTYTWMPGNFTGAVYSDCPNSTTTYTVIGTSNGGSCVDTALVTVSVFPNPSVTATAAPNPNCAGSTYTLAASGAITYTWNPGAFSGATMVITAGSSTIYTLTGCDGNGCCSSSSVAVQTFPTPTLTFTMMPNGPQVWDAVATYGGGTGAFTYNWNWGDGSPNSNVAYPSHTYTAAGWYNICGTVTDANGCVASSCVNDSLYKMSSANAMITVNVVAPLTGVAQTAHDKFLFYPNPANKEFSVETNTPCKIELFDLSGKKVLSKNLTGKTIIETASLSEGIYMLNLHTADRSSTRKLIIIH